MLIKENWFRDNETETDIVKDVESQNIKLTTFDKNNYEHHITLGCFYHTIMKSSDDKLQTKYLALTMYILDNAVLMKDYAIEFAIYKDAVTKRDDKPLERISFSEYDIDSFEKTAKYFKEKLININVSFSGAFVDVNIYFNINSKSTIGAFGLLFIKIFRRATSFFSGYDPNSHYFQSPTSYCDSIFIDDTRLFDSMRYDTLFSFSSHNPSDNFSSFVALYKLSGGTNELSERDIELLSKECHWDKVTQRLLAYKYNLIPRIGFDIYDVEERNNIRIEANSPNAISKNNSKICIIRMSDLYKLFEPDPESSFNNTWRIKTKYSDISLIVDLFDLERNKPGLAKFYFAQNTTINILIDGITEEQFKWFIHSKTDDLDVQSIYISNISDIDLTTEESHTITLIDDDTPSTVKILPYEHVVNDTAILNYDIKTTKKKGYYQTITLKTHDNTKQKKRSSKSATK